MDYKNQNPWCNACLADDFSSSQADTQCGAAYTFRCCINLMPDHWSGLDVALSIKHWYTPGQKLIGIIVVKILVFIHFWQKGSIFPLVPDTNGNGWLCCRFQDIIAVQLQLVNREQKIFLNFGIIKTEMINLITIFYKLPGRLSVKAFKNFLSDVPAWNHKLRLLWTHFWMQSGQHYPMPVLWNYPHWGSATIH